MEGINSLLAQLAGPVHAQRSLRLHTSLGAEVLVAETLSGIEQVDGLGFQWEIGALSVDAGLDLAPLVGQAALLQLQQADGSLRPFHGRITSAECVGSNGGLARYQLRLQPWLAFLSQRVDSYVFLDKTVVEIIEDIFADYGALTPAWRWAVKDASRFATRSLTTQYQETDLAFVQRLLAEEGVYTWFEHEGEAESANFGQHTLVLADHHADIKTLGCVRFHRGDATERSDTVQHWEDAHTWRVSQLQRSTWDYRSTRRMQGSAQAGEGDGFGICDTDTCGPYGWQTDARGQERAQQHLDAQRVEAHLFEGRGQWRAFAPGAQFTLDQHPQVERDTPFMCLSVRHQARNNLEADVFDAVEQLLGPASVAPATLSAPLLGLSNTAALASPVTTFYDNQFTCLPLARAYRPQTTDAAGRYLHPKPRIQGALSAIVVSDGGPILTDRDHRIKVQFPWQRGGDASHALAHPGGDDNAPANQDAWTWVRVLTPWAGDNWGGVVLPRKGQEVLVTFLEGDIDRPVLVGAHYNGRGQQDAQHNQVAGGRATATGNATAWFEGNQHAAVYTGIKTQALAQSQDGSGGYQQLRFDDSPEQGRTQLSTTQESTTLTLGHLKGGQDNVREGERGYGVELASHAYGGLRAGQGLLLTTEPGSPQLAIPSGMSQLEQANSLLQTLAESAKTQRAQLPEDPDALPADKEQQRLRNTLASTWRSGKTAIPGGDGETLGWSAPHLVGSGQAGVLSQTLADQTWVSGTDTVLAATSINWMTQGSLSISAADGLVLYTVGGKAPKDSPNQERGIALHAAQNKVSARAHKNIARLAAKTQVRVASTEADIEINAPSKHLLATATGAYIKIEGDNIELGAPGTIEFKAARKEWMGPAAVLQDLSLPQGEFCLPCFLMAARAGGALVPV